MNISTWPGSRSGRFSPVCLFVIFCLGCSTTPKSTLEIVEAQYSSGITLEPDQRINVKLKGKRIVRMDGDRVHAGNVDGNLFVVDSGNINGKFAVFDLGEVKQITVDDRSAESNRFEAGMGAKITEGTICVFTAFLVCPIPALYNKVYWVTEHDNKNEDHYRIAFKWYRSAADQGAPAAMANLGTMYAEGKGVARDKKIALEWYELAVANGIAEHRLGDLYFELKAGLGDVRAQNDRGAISKVRKLPGIEMRQGDEQ